MTSLEVYQVVNRACDNFDTHAHSCAICSDYELNGLCFEGRQLMRVFLMVLEQMAGTAVHRHARGRSQ